MRFFSPARIAVLAWAFAACASHSQNPPPLDNVGNVTPPVGGGPGGGDSGTPASDGGASGVVLNTQAIPTPRAIAVSGLYVYVAVASGADDAGVLGGVLAIPKGGGAAQTFVSGIDSPVALATSASTLCLSTEPAGGSGVVVCAPLGGGSVATLVSGESGISSLAIDGANVFWANSQGGIVVERSALTGGGVATVGTATGSFAPTGVAAQNGNVYIATSGAAANVYAVAEGGGVPAALDSPVQATYLDPTPSGTQVIIGHAIDASSGEILGVPVSGQQPTVLASSIPPPAHLAKDTAHLYWTSPVDGTVYAVPLAGGALSIVGSGLTGPSAIAVDDFVYVTTFDGVVRLPRL